MRYTDLSGAQLPSRHCTGALLEGANFTKANLNCASFAMDSYTEDGSDGSSMRWDANLSNRNLGTKESNASTIFERENLTDAFFIKSKFPGTSIKFDLKLQV